MGSNILPDALCQAPGSEGANVQVVQGGTLSAAAPVSKTLTATNDVSDIVIRGAQWATAKIAFGGVFNGTVQPEITLDAKNWINAPYAKRTDATSANPTVSATVADAAAGATWEVPLPANCLGFRVRQTAGTVAGAVTVSGGQRYVPGVGVPAVLYDVTSGTAAALDTGTLDLSGWNSASHWFSMSSGTPGFNMQLVDDAGTSSANLVTSTTGFMGGFGLGGVIGGTAGIVAATSQLQPPRRMRYQSAAIASQTSRIRVEARR